MQVRVVGTFLRVLTAAVVATASLAAAAAEPAGTASADPAVSTAPRAAGSAQPLDSGDLHAWLDGLLPYAMKSGEIAGVVIAVVKDGSVILQQGYGYADVENKIPMDAERTMVRPGSTSKLFTWTAVMQLVEQGKIDLDRDINEYLDFRITPESGRPITMLDLMHHRAGLEEGLKDILAVDPSAVQSTETYLKQHPRPMLFPPGDVPAYSNYGAALAGYIVERVSGEPFERYLEQHIFVPLGMLHSSFDQPLPDRFDADTVSRGYRSASMPPQPYELIATRPAGSMTTTAADMTRFMLAHLQRGQLGDYRMLSGETTRLMHTPSVPGALPGFGTMAHGFFHEIRNGRTVLGHGGDSVFFHTEFELLPQENVGIFYTFNSRGRDESVYGLRKALFDDFMNRYFPATSEPQQAPMLESAARDALKIAGRYESSRRVEHGFLSVFYLLQQLVITADADGTIKVPRTLEPGEATFHEIAPDLWHEIGGNRQLALREVNGVKTVIDSEDPTSVLQAVPLSRSASLNLTVMLGSIVILALTIILWLISWRVRRHYRAPAEAPEVQRLRRWLGIAVIVEVLYVAAWIMLLTPILNLELWVYSTEHDALVRTLQIAGLPAIAAAAVGIWCLWRLSRLQPTVFAWLRNAALAAAFLGIVWIGFVGRLFSFNLNY
jgi:CubicO group peptidase (beta-lactamase class C family)